MLTSTKSLIALAWILLMVAGRASALPAPDSVIDGLPGADPAGFGLQLRVRANIDRAAVSALQAPDQVIDGLEEWRVQRAELSLQGRLSQRLAFKLDVDAASTPLRIRDANLSIFGPRTRFRVGQQSVVESLMSQATDEFVDSSAIRTALSRGRQTGMSIAGYGRMWAVTVGVYDGSVTGQASSGERSISSRLAFYPLVSERSLVHLGAYGSPRWLPESNQSVSYSTRTTFLLESPSIERTHQIERDWLDGIELALTRGPVTVEGQCARLRGRAPAALDGSSGSPPRSVTIGEGCYASAIVYLTGQSRGFQRGRFIEQIVESSFFDGGAGVWQLVARRDTLTLTDNAAPDKRLARWTLGVNWFASDNLRLSINHVVGRHDSGSSAWMRTRGYGGRIYFQHRW